MRRPPARVALAVVLASLLIATGAAAAHGPGVVGFTTLPEGEEPRPIPPPDFESTERLVLPQNDAVTADGAVRQVPTAATAHTFEELGADYREYVVAAEMDAANGSQAELAVVRAELERIDDELDRLLERERHLRVDMAREEIDGDRFLAQLAYIHLRSEILVDELESLSDAIREVTAPVTQESARRLRGEVSQVQLEVRTLQGPLTDRAARAILTEAAPPDSVLMRVGRDGYVMSAIDGGVFVRQSLAAENRQPGVGTGFTDIDEARALTADLYPWTVAEADESEDIPRGEIYASTIDHPHGTTGIFIDSATERPFRDHHELDLFSLPTREATTHSQGGVSIAVARTYSGGPAQIVVASDGEPVPDAEIVVSGREIGSTGPSGSRWFVAPSESFEITVRTPAEDITVPVELFG